MYKYIYIYRGQGGGGAGSVFPSPPSQPSWIKFYPRPYLQILPPIPALNRGDPRG